MAKQKKAPAVDSETQVEDSAAQESNEQPKAKKGVFKVLKGMIRLLRKPLKRGEAARYRKTITGVKDSRNVLKNVLATLVPDGGGWMEWVMQDNDANRADIESSKDPHYLMTAIYPDDADPKGTFAQAVEKYIERLESDLEDGQKKTDAVQQKGDALAEEMKTLMEKGHVSEFDNERLETLRGQESAIRDELFDLGKVSRFERSQLKVQKELLASLK